MASTPCTSPVASERPSELDDLSSTSASNFTIKDDLLLLRCVLGYEEGNPFDYGSGSWREISLLLNQSGETVLQSCMMDRTVRDRSVKLVTKHRTNTNWKRRQSGATEDYTEKIKLMDEAYSLYENRKNQGDLPRARARRDEAADKVQGEARRQLAASTLAEKSNQ